MRGEYLRLMQYRKALLELPPHARRIPEDFTTETAETGTTSACAENTCGNSNPISHQRNYLRMRGEYAGVISELAPNRELPPHARRIPSNLIPKRHNTGTTSACAENTRLRCRKSTLTWNYLRMRGEYLVIEAPIDSILELPPHARRIRRSLLPETTGSRTTSACAENTDLVYWNAGRDGNYLRMRGEYSTVIILVSSLRELPPHARRIPNFTGQRTDKTRTTSACAENTSRAIKIADKPWNYLRMRGEYPK